MPDPTMTPTRLWKTMTATQRTAAAAAFWSDEQTTDDQIQAVMLIAQLRSGARVHRTQAPEHS